MQLPSIRQLTFLIALADKGSFIAAADSVFVTQPSLSAGLKELETISVSYTHLDVYKRQSYV